MNGEFQSYPDQTQINSSFSAVSTPSNIYNDYDNESGSIIKNVINKTIDNNENVRTTEISSESHSNLGSKIMKSKIHVKTKKNKAASIAGNNDEYKAYLNQLKNFGKTSSLSTISVESKSVGPVRSSSVSLTASLKPSLSQKTVRHTSIQVENLNSS